MPPVSSVDQDQLIRGEAYKSPLIRGARGGMVDHAGNRASPDSRYQVKLPCRIREV